MNWVDEYIRRSDNAYRICWCATLLWWDDLSCWRNGVSARLPTAECNDNQPSRHWHMERYRNTPCVSVKG